MKFWQVSEYGFFACVIFRARRFGDGRHTNNNNDGAHAISQRLGSSQRVSFVQTWESWSLGQAYGGALSCFAIIT